MQHVLSDSNSTEALFQLVAFLVIVVGGGVFAFTRRWSIGRNLRRTDDTDVSDGSAIISFYTAGHPLLNGGEGKVNGMRYLMYLSMPADRVRGDEFVSEDSIIYCLDLPFNTQTHLLGLSKEYKLDRLKFESFLHANGMQKITLEGDFPDYFDLYASANQDLQVRMVLDPSAMEFVEDYCHDHFWEIHDSELYFAITSSDKENEDFVQQSAQFVSAIKPALLPGEAGAAVVHHDTPYGEYDGPALTCPICHITMDLHDDSWFTCTNGHGALLTGRQLIKIVNKQLQIISPDASKATTHGSLSCPHCGNPMEMEHYEEGPVIIYSCNSCTFRWIDADALAKLTAHSSR